MREDWRWRGTSKPSEIWSCCGLDSARGKGSYGVANRAHGSGGLTKAEVERYGRQIVLPSLGPEGQRQLLQGLGAHSDLWMLSWQEVSSLLELVVSVAPLRCTLLQQARESEAPSLSLFLLSFFFCFPRAQGVGRLGIADADTVAVSNLHRQIGHSCGGAKAKARKAESLARACAALNDAVRLEPHPVRLSELQAAARLMAGRRLGKKAESDSPRKKKETWAKSGGCEGVKF